MALTEASPIQRIIYQAGPKYKVTLAGTVSKGDLIGYSTGWKRALATVGTAIPGRFVALADGESGDIIEVTREAVIGGFSGGTPGGGVYSAEGTSNGQYTETVPTTQNDVNTQLGDILDAATIAVNIPGTVRTLAP